MITCFWTVVLEKTLESPLACKEIQPVHSEGDQPWDFFGRNHAKADTPVLLPPHAKSWLIGKDSDPGRDWGQEEKGTTEDEMAGWHHRLDGREFEWTLGDGDGQGGLACCDSWGRKESDMTEWLNWTELNWCSRGVNFLVLRILCMIHHKPRISEDREAWARKQVMGGSAKVFHFVKGSICVAQLIATATWANWWAKGLWKCLAHSPYQSTNTGYIRYLLHLCIGKFSVIHTELLRWSNEMCVKVLWKVSVM